MPAVELEAVSIWRRTQEELAYDLKRIVLQSLERRYRKPSRRQILRQIDLQIEHGEKVGIIGANGAGKSTLLKIICGILRPTSGRVSVHGRIAPLIELGAGFDPELSLVENIIYYGVLLGFGRVAMRERVGSILEFAELTEYAQAPLKTLSSGMAARLGFALATDQRPDIFILDEVLSVGDEHFKHKSVRRIAEFWDAHSTIIVVSHDIDFIATQCERVIWLDHGTVVAAGPAAAVAESYLESVDSAEAATATHTSVAFGLDRATHGTQTTELQAGERPPTVRLVAGEHLTLEGWAADVESRHAARTVVFDVGPCIARVSCNVPRADVARAFDAPEMERSGYQATLATELLRPGVHPVSLRIITGPSASYRFPAVLNLEVVPPAP